MSPQPAITSAAIRQSKFVGQDESALLRVNPHTIVDSRSHEYIPAGGVCALADTPIPRILPQPNTLTGVR